MAAAAAPVAYIVDGVRTAGGRNRGRLSHWHPADLGAEVVDALITRNKIPPADVDDVIFGCVSPIGAQAGNIGRSVVLSSKLLPLSVPGVSVDRQCGSGQQAIHFAAQAVMSGTQDMVIAGGVEIMSLIPIGSPVVDGLKNNRGHPQGPKINAKWPGITFSQFTGAELIAAKHGLKREEIDHFAYESHRRAYEATKAGCFKNEIIPVLGKDPKTGEESPLVVDEGIRWPADLEKMSKLKPMAGPQGMITPASSSQVTDGAAAMLICNEAALKRYGLKPRARIVSMALAGSDPVVMLEAPIPAAEAALKKAGLSVKDIDLFEVNEAFASVPMSFMKALNVPHAKMNVHGGACALGHPLGATGAKLMTTLVNALEQKKLRYGLLAICEGGGTANATIIERIEQPLPSRL